MHHSIFVVFILIISIYNWVQYKKRSEKDLFTGTYHKYFFFEGSKNKLIQRMKKVKKDPRNQFGALFIDLDNFKEINDTKGHIEGDKILLSVVSVLKKNIREKSFKNIKRFFISFSLNSFYSDYIIRYGGDEFLIILKNIKNVEDLQKIATRILVNIRQDVKITASIGGSIFTNVDDIHQEKFMLKIDKALYQAKEAGRNCVRIA